MKSLAAVLMMLLFAACQKQGGGTPTPTPVAPTISSISPTSGVSGTVVTITGTGFAADTADNQVQFNGVTAALKSASATSLQAIAPAGATSGKISVTTAGGSATGPVFTYIVSTQPTLSKISPDSGAAGTTVTLTGTNFQSTPSANTVKFNGVAATVTSATTTQLVVTAPAGGTSGNITVTTAGGTSNGLPFNYVAVTDIYLVGQADAGPAYWKNGTMTAMPSDCFIARSIFVDGTDVYVAGTSTSQEPAYWKNGTMVSLPMTAGHNGGLAESITVSNGDVYVAGSDAGNGAYSLPRCWKNGTALTLSPLSTNYALGNAQSVFVSGSDVYVAGVSDPSNGSSIATFWKNGVPTGISDGTSGASISQILVSGSDVYCSGYIIGRSPLYWKNGNPVPLSVPDTTGDFYGRGIYVSAAGDVYVCGEYVDIAKYWKNGTLYDLTSTTSSLFQESSFAITGKGDDVYIAGTSDNPAGTGYWKNGTLNVVQGAQHLYGVFVK